MISFPAAPLIARPIDISRCVCVFNDRLAFFFLTRSPLYTSEKKWRERGREERNVVSYNCYGKYKVARIFLYFEKNIARKITRGNEESPSDFSLYKWTLFRAISISTDERIDQLFPARKRAETEEIPSGRRREKSAMGDEAIIHNEAVEYKYLIEASALQSYK